MTEAWEIRMVPETDLADWIAQGWERDYPLTSTGSSGWYVDGEYCVRMKRRLE
jgi:hypothetical protein